MDRLRPAHLHYLQWDRDLCDVAPYRCPNRCGEWIALDRQTRRPALAYPRLRVVRFSGRAFTAGVETHRIEGERVRVYSVAKTVADAFKYRNKVGLDVALEALREAWRGRRFTMDEIQRSARICRVQRVMRPYLEALVE